MIRLMIADSHPIMVHGFIDQLESEPDFRIVAQAGSSREAIKKVGEQKPDVILLDTELLKNGGASVLAAIKLKKPGIKIVLETIDLDYSVLTAEARLGVDAYLPACPTTAQTKEIIERVFNNLSSPVLN